MISHPTRIQLNQLLVGASSLWRQIDSHTDQTTFTILLAEREAATKVQKAQIDSCRSVDVLIRFLTDRRQKYALALSSLPSTQRPSSIAPRAPTTAAELYQLPDVSFDKLSVEQLIKVAVITDTALFRCYLSEKKMMLGSLCRIENWCEVEEVEEALLAASVRSLTFHTLLAYH